MQAQLAGWAKMKADLAQAHELMASQKLSGKHTGMHVSSEATVHNEGELQIDAEIDDDKFSVEHGEKVRILLPEQSAQLDIGSCHAEGEHESWATRLVFKKLGDKGSTGELKYGDAVGIFSAETGQRLDAGNATCEQGHASWATVFEVRSADGDLKYNSEMGLFSSENGRRLDISAASADGGHESWATKFVIESVIDDDITGEIQVSP